MHAEHLWRPNRWAQRGSVWCVSAVVTATVRDLWGMQYLVHQWQKCIANGGSCWKIVFPVAENLLYQSLVVLFLCIVVSMEINRRHYFQREIYIYIHICNATSQLIKRKVPLWKKMDIAEGTFYTENWYDNLNALFLFLVLNKIISFWSSVCCFSWVNKPPGKHTVVFISYCIFMFATK